MALLILPVALCLQQLATSAGDSQPSTPGVLPGLDLQCDVELISFNLNNSNVPVEVCLPPEDSDIIGRTMRRAGMWPQCEDIVNWWAYHLPFGGLFVDAGAHIGACSMHLILSKLATQVIAVEPNPVAGFYFQQTLRLNPFLRQSIRVVHAGVDSDIVTRHGRFALSHLAAGHLHGGYVQQRARDLADPTRDMYIEYESETITLDALLPGEERIALLKIDVEGFELRALQGARQLLSQGRIDGIFFELNSVALSYTNTTAVEVVNYLLSFGYRLYDAAEPAGSRHLERPDLVRKVTCGLLDVAPEDKAVTGLLFDLFAKLAGPGEREFVDPLPEECPWERLWCWEGVDGGLRDRCCDGDDATTAECWDETYTQQRCCGDEPFYYAIGDDEKAFVFDPRRSVE
ncbi:hypothetical protein FOZ62_004202 [Perkinsus olseni]|uniref:Methyltransferase FkbM domain-containing protein n=1 Tax=Perkinsus olseni TaxID=32597 RepID=A0A7J6T6Z7_PEROL|nr:hypothetical protein FOZ62_004202 [Perkinsus olseni]